MSYAEKKYFKYSNDELKALLITTVVIAFIFSFTLWGETQFNASFGIRNFIITFILVAIAIGAKTAVQKYSSIKLGFNVEYKPWPLGLFLGIFFVFLSNGNFIFLGLGGMGYYLIERMRIGKEQFGFNFGTIGWLSVLGPLTNIVLAAIFKILSAAPNLNELMIHAMQINIWFAVFGILPIPFMSFATPWRLIYGGWKNFSASEGLNLLYASRWAYVGILILTLTAGALLNTLPITQAIISTIVITFLGWILYFLLYEHEL